MATAQPSAMVSASLFATLSAQSRFSTLTEQLKRPEFLEIYNLLTSTTSRYTLFAPSNQAFSNLIASDPGLFSDVDRLRKILLYHLVQGELPTTELVKITRIETLLNNNPIAVSIDGTGHVRFNTSASLSGSTDLKANNGYIQEIDMVLTPPNPSQVVLPVPASTPTPTS